MHLLESNYCFTKFERIENLRNRRFRSLLNNLLEDFVFRLEGFYLTEKSFSIIYLMIFYIKINYSARFLHYDLGNNSNMVKLLCIPRGLLKLCGCGPNADLLRNGSGAGANLMRTKDNRF